MSRLLPLAALAVTLPASAQQSSTVDDDGPADFAMLQSAVNSVAAGKGLYLAPFSIAFHLQLPLGVLALGTVPAGGVQSPGLPVPPSSGLEGVRFVGQSLFIGGTGLFDGGPSTIVVLGGAL